MSLFKKLCLILGTVIAAGCQTTVSEPSANFGAAVKHNITAQAIEPTPEQKQNTYIRPDSNRTAIARERYRKDEVEKPKELQTTE